MPENWGEPSTWQALPANQSVDLSLLAELSGIPDETLRRGNPELRKEVTPPNPDHLIKVPIAMAEAAKAILDDTSRPLIRFYSYKVKSGDNVGAIARGYKTTITTIVGANPGLDPDRIQIGQILKIPAYGGAKPPAETASAPAPKHATNAANLPATETPTNSAQASATEPAAGKPDPAPPAQIVAPAPAATPSQSPPVFSSSHTVVKGDTIWNISRRYKIKPEVLAEKNGLRLEGIIKIGQVLAVPALN
jgi:membrane-bound lytic murein transglycosylase D